MNRKIIVGFAVATAMIANTFSNIYAVNNYNSKKDYYGTPDYYGRYISINYTDTKLSSEAVATICSLGVMNGTNRKFYPNKLAAREEVIASILKLMNVSVLSTTSSTGQKSISSSAWAKPYIAEAVTKGILSSNDLKTLNFKKAVTKEEMAYWLAMALKLKPSDKMLVMTYLKDASTVNRDYSPYIEQLLLKGIMWDSKQSYFKPKTTITRLNLANILNDVFNMYNSKFGYSIQDGQVVDVVKDINTVGKTKKETDTIYIKDGAGSYETLKAYKVKGMDKDFIVYKGKKIGLSSAIKKGDFVNCISRGSAIALVKVNAQSLTQSTVQGDISNVDSNSITVVDGKGVYNTFKLSANTQILINGELMTAKELVVDQNVTVKAMNGYALDINSNVVVDGESDSKYYVTGSVEGLNDESIQLDCNGIKREYQISQATSVFKGSKAADMYSIKVGNLVKLSIDKDMQCDQITIESIGGNVEYVFKGTILDYNDMDNSVVIKDLYNLNNGQWSYMNPQQKLDLAQDAQIYLNGGIVSGEDIKNNIGKEVYGAVVDNAGQTNVQKLSIKVGSENQVNDTISDVNLALNRIKIQNGDNLSVDDGSIVVYNNKLVDKNVIDKDDNAFIAVDRNNNIKTAGVLAIVHPSINNILEHYNLYMGRLDALNGDTLVLGACSGFDNNQWAANSQSTNVILNTEAAIMDSTLNNTVTKIPYTSFISSNYIVDPNNLQRHPSYYSYVIADQQKNVKGIYIMGGSPNLVSQRVRTGKIKSIVNNGLMGNVMTVTDTKEWNNLDLKWRSMPADNSVLLTTAFVFKNDKLTDISDLNEGDEIVFINDGNNIGIFVK